MEGKKRTPFLKNPGVQTLIASLLFVLSIAQNSPKYYRLLFFTNSIVWIGYDLLAKSWGNLFTHIVLVFAISISMFINDRKTKNED